MTGDGKLRRFDFAHRVSSTLSAAVALGGILIILGWILDIPHLVRIHPQFPSTPPVAALALTLGSCSLLLLNLAPSRRREYWRRGLAVAALIFAIVGTAENFSGRALIGEQHLQISWPEVTGLPGKPGPQIPSPGTTANLLLISLAVLALKRRPVLAQAALFTVLPLSFISVLRLILQGFGYDPVFWQSLTGMALPTSLASFAICTAGLLSRSEAGMVGAALGGSRSAALFRRMLAFVFLIPLLLILTTVLTQVANTRALLIGAVLLEALIIASFVAFSWITSEALRRKDEEREAIYRNLLKAQKNSDRAQRAARLGNWEWNLRSNELRWSDEIYRLFGVSRATFGATYEAFLGFVHPDDRDRVREAVTRALREHYPYELEHRIILKDGTERILHEEGEILLGDDLRPTFMIGTVQDVTESRKVERELRESEQKLRVVLDTLPIGVWVTNSNGQIIISNEASRKIRGAARFVGAGQSREHKGWWADTGRPIEPDEWAAIRAISRGESTLNELIEIQTPDGTRKTVLNSAVPLRDSAGKIAGAVVLNEDVTEDIRAERYQRTLAAIGDQLVRELDPDAMATQAAQILARELSDCAIIFLRSEKNRIRIQALACRSPSAQQACDLALRGREEQLVALLDVRGVLHRGDAQIVGHVSESQIRDVAGEFSRDISPSIGTFAVVPLLARGKILGAIALTRGEPSKRFARTEIPAIENLARAIALAIDNVTLYRDSRDAVRLREDILGIVSHDLKNPMTSMLMSGKLILRNLDQLDRQRIEKLGHSIEGAATHALNIIRDLLDFTQIQAGAFHVSASPYELTKVLQQLQEIFEPQAHAKSIRLQFETPDGKLSGIGDPAKLAQALSNVIGNAVKFTPPGGSVTVRAAYADQHIRVEVLDTGPGIPPDVLPVIFFRYTTGRAKSHEGLGLGLFIAKGIIQAHGGRIWAESLPGKGSRFVILLPGAAEARKTA